MIKVENRQFFVQKCHFGGEIGIQILIFANFYNQQKNELIKLFLIFSEKKYPSIKSNNEKFLDCQ